MTCSSLSGPLLTVLWCMTGCAGAFAQAWPAKAVRMIVPSAPGGGNDAVARIVSSKLSDVTGTTWVVDNRSGGAGNLAAEIVVRASPDGYTVMIATSTMLTVNPALYKLPFSYEKDLQPITQLATAEHIVAVHPGVPVKTLNELITLAKQQPGTLNYASAGVGNSTHLSAELLTKRAGIRLVNVTYKGGGPAASSVLAGETQVIVGTGASTAAFIKAGRLRALATTGLKRSKLAPELPTVAESGYPGFEAIVWFALFVPRDTPKSIAAKFRDEVIKVVQQTEVQTAMARQGLEVETGTPAALAARIRSETELLADIIKGLGLRIE